MKRYKKYNKHYILHSQLDLPFLETRDDFLEKIFSTLEKRFKLKKDSRQNLIDLGAGDGRIIEYSALNYHIISVGIEINKNLVDEVNSRIEKFKKSQKVGIQILEKMKMEHGDIYEQTLMDFQYIYIFSLPTMQKYLKHVFNTACKGAIFIAYKYPLENFKYLKLKYKLILSEKLGIKAFFYEKTF